MNGLKIYNCVKLVDYAIRDGLAGILWGQLRCAPDAEARHIRVVFTFSKIQWRIQSTLRCTCHIPPAPAPAEVLQVECLRLPG
jgi:hypothetical protein